MALTTGHFYTPKSDSSQLLLCTDSVAAEFMQLPSGNVQKYAADPSTQLQDLQTMNLSAGGVVPSDGFYPSCLLDGADYQIMEAFSTDGTFPNTSMLIVRPKGLDIAEDRAAYLAIPVACVTDTNPPNLFAPQVFSVTPAAGLPAAGGTPIVIKGTGFKNASAVDAGGAASALVVIGDTEIHCKTHAHAAGTVAVLVTTPGGTSTATASANITFA